MLPGGGVVVTMVNDSLSGFAGGKAIILEVDATNPAAGQDWAVWQDARIEH